MSIPSRTGAFLAFCCSIPWAVAQVPLQVIDALTALPVPQAHVVFATLPDASQAVVVTGPDGRTVLPVSADAVARGVVLQVSFVGYHPWVDTLRSPMPPAIVLRPAVGELGEVVITGQYAPSTTQRAVHRIRVLDAKRFQQMAANHLGDVLRNELNIRIGQDNVLGASVSMLGLGGENVKILVDGVPVVGRMDGNIDLAQLDLTGIERVEVIEGPLSVTYGTNALAGTINLITTKGGAGRSAARAAVYTEHIGRLNTTITAGRSGRWGSVRMNAGRNFFGGWDPRQPGGASFAPRPADTSRVQQWKPREQYFARLGYRWQGAGWSLGYKGEYLHDVIVDRGQPRAPYFETAFDQRFLTRRLDHALFADAVLGDAWRLQALAAHNRFTRLRNTWFRDLTTLEGMLVPQEAMQDTARFQLTNVRTVFAWVPDGRRWSGELGFDGTTETGSGDRLGGDVRSITDLAVFSTMEVGLTERLVLRPGVRWAYNSRYAAPVIPSVHLRWGLTDRTTVRASYARGFRAPSLKELYLDFVDVNHDITGNADLLAETGHHGNAAVAFRKGTYRAEANMFLNVIADQIALVQVTGARFTYANVGFLRTTGATASATWDDGRWALSLGGGITWRYDALAERDGEPLIHTPEATASLARRWERSGWSAAIFARHQGYLATYASSPEGTLIRGHIAPFTLLDANVGRALWSGRMRLAVGCKDILDVRNVQAAMAGGVHSTGASSVPMTTGRTWFLRLDLDLLKP